MANNSIRVKGEVFRYEEALASGTVKPGYLLEITSAGAVKAHATEGGYAERAVAVEDALQGNTTATSYSSGTRVLYTLEAPGNEVQIYLKANESVVIGDKLISAGDGSLIKNGSEASGTTVRQIIGYAMEALDLTDSGDVATLLKVRLV